jgi:hypothetical protein
MYLHAPAPPPAALVVDALGQPRPQHLAARQEHRRTSLVDTLALVITNLLSLLPSSTTISCFPLSPRARAWKVLDEMRMLRCVLIVCR